MRVSRSISSPPGIIDSAILQPRRPSHDNAEHGMPVHSSSPAETLFYQSGTPQKVSKEFVRKRHKSLLLPRSPFTNFSFDYRSGPREHEDLMSPESLDSTSVAGTPSMGDRTMDPSSAAKLTKRESYKAQRKNYRREKKRVTKELMSTLADPAVVVIADWLKVRGTLKSWTKLWCVLKPGLLLLYKSAKTHKSSQWVATVLLNACEVIERPSKKDGFCFKIFHPLERSIWASRGPNGESIGALVQPLPMAYLIFRASSESAGKCWMDALELALRCTSLLMRTMSGGKQTFQLAASDDGDLVPSSKHWTEHDLEKHFPFHDEEDELHADSSVMTEMTQNGEHSMHSSETDSDAEHFDEEEDAEPIETPYVENGVEEFGIAGDAGQTEEVAEENKSLIWTLVKQVRPGMDLSRVVLPTFILEPRSFLDKLSDYHYHADLLSKAVLEDDPFTRMKEIVRWYLSGFYKKPKGLKKPYNPILGETFRCYWKHPNTGSRTFYIAEQVSHHPPISSFFVTNRQDGFCISGTILAKSKFYGNSLSAILDGTGHLTLLPRGENYNITMPYAHCKGILLGTLTMELGGKVDISCEKTGYRTELEFKLKPFLGGPELCNLVSGKIKLGKETLATIEGHWDGDIFFKDKRSDEETLLWSPTPDVRAKRLKRYTVPIDSQSEFESERLWQHVSAAIQRGDQLAATDEKTLLEDAQRKATKERLSKMEKWSSRYFSQDLIMCEWVYKHLDSRPWDPRNDVLQYEKDYIIKTKTHHKTPVVRTNSIVSMEEKRHNEVLRHMSRASMAQQGSQLRSSLTSHGSESSSPDAIHRGSDSTESDEKFPTMRSTCIFKGLLRHQRTNSGSMDILALQQALEPLNQMQEESHKTLQTIQHHLEGIMAQQNRIHQQLAQRSDLTLIASVILVQLVLHILTFWWWT